MAFKIQSPYLPAGDQPEAIRQLIDGLVDGERYQTLLGVTGSGKTFTIANVIQAVQRPTLVLSCTENSDSFFRKMLLVILSPIMITTNRRLICRLAIPI